MKKENTSQTTDRHGVLRRFIFFLKFLEIRLRFVLILVVTALVVGYWDHIQNHYERWQRERGGKTGEQHASHAHGQEAQSEFEHFCPMHPFVVRSSMGKCPICGMDLVKRKKGAPVELPPGTLARVQVAPERVMQAGVQVEPVMYRLLARSVRTYGVIEPDEARLAKIVARFPGRVDDLLVNAVGMTVNKNDPLARIYSPKFLAAAQEYLQALRSERQLQNDARAGVDEKRRARQLTDFARQRLLLAGFSDEQLDAIADDPKQHETVTLYAPQAGTVLEKNILEGQMVDEGTPLYTITDLSRLWVQVLVIESDMSAVRPEMPVEVNTVSYPGEIFYGTVDFIYPTIDPQSRSGKVRVVVDNRQGKLKPGMYVMAAMNSPLGHFNESSEKMKTEQEKTEEAKKETTRKKSSIKPPTEKEADAQAFLAALKNGGQYYFCPMDGEVVSDKKDDCPKCGMSLVPKTKGEETKAISDTHTMDQQEVPAKPAANQIKLPTQTKADAEKYLASLPVGAQYYVCSMDPEVISDKANDDCPLCGMKLTSAIKTAEAAATVDASTEQWAEGYTCPMHPTELSDEGGVCKMCGCGMEMKKWRVERVLAIPESAVIDTGTRKVVYLEEMPGVYDARAVTLGPRAGNFYPVIDGLTQGQRIVTRGSFLIDAETRLNPSTTAGAGGHQHVEQGEEKDMAEKH